MAQQALGAGTVVPRKRALFGLLDADGWAWASVKAFVWLVIIILMLGYIPDRAYYFTVVRTIDLGVIVWSPINLCPPRTSPCRARRRSARSIPWQRAGRARLPAAATDGAVVQVGTKILYIGGSDGTTAQSTVYVAPDRRDRQLRPWADGPRCPSRAPTRASRTSPGSIYVIGGMDAAGKPTTTVFVLTPDSADRRTSASGSTADDLTLPEARAGLPSALTPDGLLLIGGRERRRAGRHDAEEQARRQGALGAWIAEAAARHAAGRRDRRPSSATSSGSTAAATPTARPARSSAARSASPRPRACRPTRTRASSSRGTSTTPRTCRRPRRTRELGRQRRALPRRRHRRQGPQSELYWAIPTTHGDIPEWKHLDVERPAEPARGRAGGHHRPERVLVGGKTAEGVVATERPREHRAADPVLPARPGRRDGPGLKIEGEIGQQLGYLNAAGVGTVDFIILLLIGWAFAHKVADQGDRRARPADRGRAAG